MSLFSAQRNNTITPLPMYLSNNNGYIKNQQDHSRRVGELKSKLKSLLVKHHGCAKHDDVVQVINELSALNPTTNQEVTKSPFFEHEFKTLTCPNFPGRIKQAAGQEDIIQYTLGGLSFNLFQPKKLACTIRGIRNPISSLDMTESDDKETFSYPLMVDIIIHSEHGDLPAIMENEAICYQHPTKSNRVQVSFNGSTLKPAQEVVSDPKKLEQWSKTFEGAYKKAAMEASTSEKMLQYLFSVMLGLTKPSDDDMLLKNTFHFDMKRSPVGYLDVLYLDNNMRITRGNRGTIVVVERNTEH